MSENIVPPLRLVLCEVSVTTLSSVACYFQVHLEQMGRRIPEKTASARTRNGSVERVGSQSPVKGDDSKESLGVSFPALALVMFLVCCKKNQATFGSTPGGILTAQYAFAGDTQCL